MSDTVTDLVWSGASWWALKQRKTFASYHWHFAVDPFLWTQVSAHTFQAANTDPGSTRRLLGSFGQKRILNKQQRGVDRMISDWTSKPIYQNAGGIKEQVKSFKDPSWLAFSHRLAHDEISPSREGLYVVVIHYIILVRISVFSSTDSHWIIIPASTVV